MDLQQDGNYILNRLRAASQNVMNLGAVEGLIGHGPTKGRHREILVDNLLRPWLPYGVACGTGLMVDYRQTVGSANQDDVVVYDPLLVPPVLAADTGSQGVFLYDSVYFRIEVKSRLSRDHISSFVSSCMSNYDLKILMNPSYHEIDQPPIAPMNALVAYTSTIARGKDLDSLVEHLKNVSAPDGLVSLFCVADRGFWKLASGGGWEELICAEESDPLAYFTGVIAQTCFVQRCARLGLKPRAGGAAGHYLPSPYRSQGFGGASLGRVIR